ncbi:MAG: serine hydrolase [Gelidibacter sp.]|uniref:serine hydrolase n=1 Tax=Gelidibacter sp. TaxID=2018083 RepID=UPI00326525F9
MKRILFFLFLVLSTNLLSAQTEKYKIAIENFQSNYNDDKYDAVFNCFSQEMKKALPIEKTKQFLTNLKSQAGNIKSMEFINYQQETYAIYKTKFEKGVFAVNISLNGQNQINGLFIKPYEESTEATNLVNTLSNYPKEIAETIFSKSKDFPNNTQLSIAIIQNEKTNYYGIIKINDTIKPAENQKKIFEIGSITKVFTSAVLASLVEDKKIKLTDAVNFYYPFTFKGNIKITFESLANHTSGLPRLPENLDLSNKTNPYKNYGKAELEEYLKNLLKLENETSKTYLYSNLGTGLLGYTLGLSQKTNFQTLLQKKIFDKYEMRNSFTSSQRLGNSLTKGLNKKGEIVSNWDFDVLFGAGGILSTTEDLAKFVNAQFNPKNKELELTRKTTFQIKDDTKIGLGWHKLESTNGQDLFWHNGGTGGYSSSIVMNVEEKTAVIILSNVFDINDRIDALSYELIKKITKK